RLRRPAATDPNTPFLGKGTSMAETHSTSPAEPVEYRPIEGHPGYRVGDDGSVWSCRHRGRREHLLARWTRLRPGLSVKGYHHVTLSSCTVFRVHRLVLEAFVGL